MTTLTPTTELRPDQFFFLQEVVAGAASLTAAVHLAVLARLAALAGLGLVEVAEDGAYRATTTHLAELAALRLPCDGLTAALRDGHPAVAGDTPSGAAALYPAVVPHLAALLAEAADRAADYLGRPGLRVLDVGAGAAPWSHAIAWRDPATRVTALDLPAVLTATRQVVAQAGLESQFEYLAGDLFAVDLDRAAYDLILVGNVCHLFDEPTNCRLLRRLFGALRPGGTLAILDLLPNERLDGPRSVTLYALGLYLRTGSGGVYPFSTYAGWLRETGYAGIERTDLSIDPPLSLITAQRPDVG